MNFGKLCQRQQLARHIYIYCFLKQKCKDLEDKIRYLEEKTEDSNSRIKNLTLKLEVYEAKVNQYKEQNEIFENDVKQKTEHLNDSELKREFLQSQLHQFKLKFDKSEENLKESRDNFAIQVGIIENKDDEIKQLKLKSAENPSDTSSQDCEKTYSCDTCDFITSNEKGLKIHTGKMHEVECTSCKCTFRSEAKLQDHICRLHITNPSYKTMYMKDWFVKDTCVRVYDSVLQNEIALLHCDNCT